MTTTDKREAPSTIHAVAAFWLGHEGALELEHIGRLITVDLYAAIPFGATKDTTQLEMTTYMGRLAGFTESRGRATYGRDDLGYQGDGVMQYPDLSVHSDKYVVNILLDDGRTFTVHDKDYANIYMPEVKDPQQ